MTAPVDPRNYLSIDAKHFCEHSVWRILQDAIDALNQCAANNVRLDCRKEAYIAYFMDTRGIGMIDRRNPPTYQYEIFVNNIRRQVYLDPSVRAALDARKAATSDLADSVARRIKCGEVEVLLSKVLDPFDPWRVLDPSRLKGFEFRSNIMKNGEFEARYAGVRYSYRIRDLVGLPLEQAIFIYGDRDLATKIAAFRMIGAPDHLKASGGYLDGLSPEMQDAPAQYNALLARQKMDMLDQLRGGSLIATRAETGVLPIKFWRDFDPAVDVATWCPGYLVRGKDRSEADDGKKASQSASTGTALGKQERRRGRHQNGDNAALRLLKEYHLDGNMTWPEAVSKVYDQFSKEDRPKIEYVSLNRRWARNFDKMYPGMRR